MLRIRKFLAIATLGVAVASFGDAYAASKPGTDRSAGFDCNTCTADLGANKDTPS